MSEIYYIKDKDWKKFLRSIIEDYTIYGMVDGLFGKEYNLVDRGKLSEIIYGQNRSLQSLREFVYPSQENAIIPFSGKKQIIIGVKACDLNGVKILDKIFLESEPQDTIYKERRKNLLIISSDCTTCGDSCFCTLLDLKPYPEDGFDLNLSHLEEGFLVEVGSEKGSKLLSDYGGITRSAGKDKFSARDERRKKITQEVNEKNKEFKFPDSFDDFFSKKYNSPAWKEAASTCVICGACTNICPSCYCFLLSDQSPLPAPRLRQAGNHPVTQSPANFEKIRSWDSCQYTGYSRVAGGANPRKKIEERLRNRYLCKLKWRPENFGILGCTGCGRCIESCQGKIDIRKVLTQINTDLIKTGH